MREESVARMREFATWLDAGRQEAIRNAGAFLTAPSIAAVYSWRDHGTALRTLARYDEALAAYDRAEQMAPLSERQDLVRANIVMARVAALQEAGRLEDAMPAAPGGPRVFATYGDARPTVRGNR